MKDVLQGERYLLEWEIDCAQFSGRSGLKEGRISSIGSILSLGIKQYKLCFLVLCCFCLDNLQVIAFFFLQFDLLFLRFKIFKEIRVNL